MTETLDSKETADLWNDWATAEMFSQRGLSAERGYRKALELEPSHHQAAANLGIFLAGLGQFEEAIPLLEQGMNGSDVQQRTVMGELLTYWREKLAAGEGTEATAAGLGQFDESPKVEQAASPANSNNPVADEYLIRIEQFNQRAMSLGLGDLSNYYWYHTIDLGEGLVTPGLFDYRHILPAFRFPEDMRGMTVLDVGSATGFFAFEFERRGARVISVEVPSLEDFDRFPGQTNEQVLRKLKRWVVPRTHSADQLGKLAR